MLSLVRFVRVLVPLRGDTIWYAIRENEDRRLLRRVPAGAHEVQRFFHTVPHVRCAIRSHSVYRSNGFLHSALIHCRKGEHDVRPGTEGYEREGIVWSEGVDDGFQGMLHDVKQAQPRPLPAVRIICGRAHGPGSV